MGKWDIHWSSNKTDWETPDHIFNPLDLEFGFTLDVCANKDNHKCPIFFTEAMNALKIPWHGVCWMNPPYGRYETPKWVKKAYQESRKPDCMVVCLLAARTDTIAWHEYVMKADEIRFIKGRITFVGASNSAPFPSAVVIFKGGK